MNEDDKMTRQLRASELRDATVNYLEDGVKTWLRGGKDGDIPVDLEMWYVTVSDVADLGKIIALIEQDKLTEAWEAVIALDTLVRDVIPERTYDWLEEHWARLDDGQKYNIVDDAGVDIVSGKFTG